MKASSTTIFSIHENVFINFSNIFLQITPGLSSLIKIEGVEDVVEGAPEKLADSLTLFCQVCSRLYIEN